MRALLLTAALCTVPVMAWANPPLKDQTSVSERIITAGIVYELANVCGSLDIRLVRGYAYLEGIKDHANSLGYSDAEIEAYIDDKAEEQRLERIARTRLANMGAVPGDEASHCAVGQAEIAKGSQIGRLLR